MILAMLLLFSVGATAAESLLWQGSKKFSGWSDVVNIEGSRFNGAEADDVLHLSITASSGAQLQLSWGLGWTCFDGLEHQNVNGDFDLLLTTQDVSRLKQGIHIKGVNFTLTAVSLRSNDGEYTTQAEDLFAWQDMLLSGATQGQTCTVGLKAYGGAGWYWPENNTSHISQAADFRKLRQAHPNKMTAMPECNSVPSWENMQRDQALWLMVAPWCGGAAFDHGNTAEFWRQFLADEHVVTRELNYRECSR